MENRGLNSNLSLIQMEKIIKAQALHFKSPSLPLGRMANITS